MKRENLKWAIASVVITFVTGIIIGHAYTYELQVKKTDSIKIEYYLEVQEDSIRIEGLESGKVYSGKYSDLDSLINIDNL